MEEEERGSLNQIPVSQKQYVPSSGPRVNGKPAGKVSSPAGRGTIGAAEGLANLAAKIFHSKVKGQGTSKADTSERKVSKHMACDDDLPLGSEAHSLSLDAGTDLDSKYPLPEDRRSKWQSNTSLGVMGWQSFNSDVSNQTSASSASLEQLLNDRQVDPEQMLLSLGFGGEHPSLQPTLARVPKRFLHHPSRAYGIGPTAFSEESEQTMDDETDDAVPSPEQATTTAASSAVMPPPKKRSGIWTLARTISLLRLKTAPSSKGHMSPSSSHPTTNQPVSILHPSNQRYLASRGFYEKQGWPRGTFAEPEDDSFHVVKEEVESRDAASKRKIFKKTRPQRNWSMCDSGENEVLSGGMEWVTKSVDDSQSREDLMGRDDSLGRGTYFSTTTESSTDSLDTPTLETKRAFENIRREYENSRQEHSSSDDLFYPSRKTRMSGHVMDNDENMDSDLDLLSTYSASTNYFVSPASSRQTTVEKALTINDQSPSINLNEDADLDRKGEEGNSSDLTAYSSGLTNKSSHVYHTSNDLGADVRIIISRSDNKNGKSLPHDVNHTDQNGKCSKLTVGNVQTASSDSGSSSSTTAVGSSSVTLTADDSQLRRLSESETSVNDWDSISRTHSPHRFGCEPDAGRGMISNSCQTSDMDFSMAASADQCVSVTSNRSLLQVQINGSTQDKMRRDYAFIEQGPRVQLSTFPPTISHLEIMRRLQHSQNELSRMGSVQSDSSGFGDADPGGEAAVMDGDHLKVRSSKEVLVGAGEGSSYIRESPKSTIQGHRYVTMCYIPALTSKADHLDSLRHRPHPAVSYQDGSSVRTWRSRSRSDPRHPDLAYCHGVDSSRVTLDGSVRRAGPGPQLERSSLLAGLGSSHRHQQTVHHRATNTLNTSDWRPRPELQRSDGDADSSKRMFTSQINVYSNSGGFRERDTSVGNIPGSPRRHSDEGMLEGRNNTPLSIELALAAGSELKSPIPGRSVSTNARIITTTTTSNMGSGAVTRDSATMGSTPTDYNTEADPCFPLLAGNITGLRKHFWAGKSVNKLPPSTCRQRSCDILDDDLEDRDLLAMPSHSRTSDDLDTGSPATENSSDMSVQFFTEGQGQMSTGILESRKLAKLINQPMHIRRCGSVKSHQALLKINGPGQVLDQGARRCGPHYRPNHLFKDWGLLSQSKRLQEESRLLRNAAQKYKTQLTIMEASFLADYQMVCPDMDESQRGEVEELELLWTEVKGQVVEMEQLLVARVKAVQAGNEFYSLLSSLGIIKMMVELIKEQMCHQEVAIGRTEGESDHSLDEDIFGGELTYPDKRHQASQGWMVGMGSTPRPIRRFQSSSTSNLPHDLNISLEQIKSSVLSQVKDEIKESTQKWEKHLQEKDQEIKWLHEQLTSRSASLSDQPPRRWTPKTSRSHKAITRSRSLIARERTSQETDV